MDKLEAQRLELQEETAAFYPLMQRLVCTFESHAQANGIELQFDYQAEQHLQLKLDTDKLERILFNLLSNALKFTPRDGKVAVTVKDAGNSIQIIVSDTGRGIHPDDLPHVFERFYQAQASPQPSPKGEEKDHLYPSPAGGAGIGLALAREYTNLMGGALSVKSALGEGSTFVFEFPKKEVFGVPSQPKVENGRRPVPDIQESQVQARTTSNGNQATLLVVEDNSGLRRFLEEILSPHYKVILAENGARAIELLNLLAKNEGQPPELIITDLMMPEMDGYTLIETLKMDTRWQSIPTIVLTARASLPDRLAALRLGIDDYLAKPFDTEELLARIGNLIQNYRKRWEWAQQQNAAGQPGMNANFPNLEQLLQSEETLPADTQWLKKVEKTAFQQVGNPGFSPKGLAAALALSGRQLRRKLKQLTGLTPTDYLREVRLQKARSLLESKTYSTVAEACHAVGLSDQKHFAKIFRQRFGKNPSDFMRKNG